MKILFKIILILISIFFIKKVYDFVDLSVNQDKNMQEIFSETKDKSKFKKQSSTDTIIGNIYKNFDLGWEFVIPKNWIVLRKDSINNLYKQFVGEEVPQFKNSFKSTIYPLSLSKGELNTMMTSIKQTNKRFDEYLRSWQEIKELTIQNQEKMYENLKFDSTSTIETIDGVKFTKFRMLGYANGIRFGIRETYSTILNDYFFVIHLESSSSDNFNSKIDVDEIRDAFLKSKFTIYK